MTDKKTKDWKHTIWLPETQFPMRANLPEREPEFLERWQQLGVYQAWQQRNNAPAYVLHDGPPYANGEIHMGHALNKILKDIVVKYQAMLGKRVPYVPGWDCHGLPIETQVSKELGKKVRELSDAEFRRECRQYASKYIDVQRQAFKRLGVVGDWDNYYRTMDFAYEAETLRRLADLVEQGYVFRRKKPVAWSLENRTALAEAELEYNDKEDISAYVLFALEPATPLPKKLKAKKSDAVDVMIWTTTPWTLPANLAVAVAPEATYGLYRYSKNGAHKLVILATVLSEKVLTSGGASNIELLGTCQGTDLKGLVYSHPFIDRTGKIALADYVTMNDGTGLVHIAPGHGADDYETGMAEGLDIYCPVKDDGTYDDSVPEWLRGKLVWTANNEIIEHLAQLGALFYQQKFVHSYPHDWRSKKPIVFRATHQWFIGMIQHNLRDKAMAAIAATKWTPAWGQNRIEGMIKNRPDWCISRQRRWGVPIAVPFCQNCGEAHLDAAMMRKVADRFEQKGADAWFEDNVHDFLAPATVCRQCGNNQFERGNDILDVWFDSGISWAAVCQVRDELHTPADLYLEGSDQHRGWFQSSLLLSVALTGHAPFKGVLTHGFTLDGKGHKMSKSAGNVVDPNKVVKQYGAEILRLWVASEQFEDDQRISDQIINGVVDSYRKIRNTFRFFAGNLTDFNPTRDIVPLEKMEPIDRWIMLQLVEFEKQVLAAYEKFAYHIIYQNTIRFCANDLSALYLDVAKDRLYCGAKNGPRRRAAQTVIYHLAETMAKLLAPIMSFTAEEIWQYIPNRPTPSVLLSTFHKPLALELSESELKTWDTLIRLRGEVLKALEIARVAKQIGHSLEARVLLAAKGGLASLLQNKVDFLPEWLIVSQVELVDWDDERLQTCGFDSLKIAVLNAQGQKCGRCWQIQPQVGKLPEPSLCQRCYDVVAAIEAL